MGNGDEITVLFSGVEGFLFTGGEENPPIEACVFVTQPDMDIDINRDNDGGCVDLSPFLSVADLAIENQINLYPIPATTEIRVDTDLQVTRYEVLDTFGKRIREEAGNNGNTIEVEGLPNGIYLLRITTDQGIATKKVVVSR